MKKILYVLLASFLLSFVGIDNADAQAKKPKTVHVKSYTTKKGKHVTAHKRSAPRRHK